MMSVFWISSWNFVAFFSKAMCDGKLFQSIVVRGMNDLEKADDLQFKRLTL